MSTPEAAGQRAHALLLAAGRGARFDPSGRNSKLLATLDGVAVVVRAARALRAAGLDVTAVVREDGRVAMALRSEGVEVFVSPRAAEGMGASLSDGVTHLVRTRDPSAIVVALGDMPHVSPDTIAAVAAAVGPAHPVAAPFFEGRRGHPVAFWRSRFGALEALHGDRGAGPLLRDDTLLRVDVGDAGILLDIDLPDDLGHPSSGK